jgi:hypothetical protein
LKSLENEELGELEKRGENKEKEDKKIEKENEQNEKKMKKIGKTFKNFSKLQPHNNLQLATCLKPEVSFFHEKSEEVRSGPNESPIVVEVVVEECRGRRSSLLIGRPLTMRYPWTL